MTWPNKLKTINLINCGCEKRLLCHMSSCNINRNSNLQKSWCQMCTYSFERKTLISVYTYRYVEWHPFVLFSSSFGCYTIRVMCLLQISRLHRMDWWPQIFFSYASSFTQLIHKLDINLLSIKATSWFIFVFVIPQFLVLKEAR